MLETNHSISFLNIIFKRHKVCPLIVKSKNRLVKTIERNLFSTL